MDERGGAPRPPDGRGHKLKKYSLQKGIIYGPVQSRRLGVSLGVNLLPTKYKLCSFNCIYCQYGWTRKGTLLPAPSLEDLPAVETITVAIESALTELSVTGKSIDSITICGNGEPTLHPHLKDVLRDYPRTAGPLSAESAPRDPVQFLHRRPS